MFTKLNIAKGEISTQRENEEHIQTVIAMHRRIKKLQAVQKQKYFSISEFFTMSKLFMLASEQYGGDAAEKYVSMKKLSQALNVSPAMVTKSVNALEERECVRRASDSSDRRGVNVCLTQKGLELWKEEYNICGEFIKNAFARFGKDKTRQLHLLTEELLELMEQEAENSKIPILRKDK